MRIGFTPNTSNAENTSGIYGAAPGIVRPGVTIHPRQRPHAPPLCVH
jgi:hypothetical protein